MFSERAYYITYDEKKKEKVISFGDNSYYSRENDDEILVIYKFLRWINSCSEEKKKDTWNGDDEFFIKATSDFLNLLVKKVMKKAELEQLSPDLFHYGVIVSSEREEEIE